MTDALDQIAATIATAAAPDRGSPAQRALKLAAARDARVRALLDDYRATGSRVALAAALRAAGIVDG